MKRPDVCEIAKAICREQCAFMGEPACWQAKSENGEELPWPPSACNDPGCLALAQAAVSAIEKPKREFLTIHEVYDYFKDRDNVGQK